MNAQEFIDHTKKVCSRLLKEVETIENDPSEMIRIKKHLEVKDENQLFVELYEMVEQLEENGRTIGGNGMNIPLFIQCKEQIGLQGAIAEEDQSYSTIPGRGSYYDTPPSPFYDALAAITNKTPLSFCEGIYSDNDITDEQHNELVTWIAKNIPIYWATNDSILEAVNLIVKRAVENNNINQKQSAITKKQAND